MTATIDVQGFAELEKQLENLTKAAGKGALRRALMKASKPLADIAQSSAPVRTGTLQASIVVGTKLNKRQAKKHRRMFKDDRASVEVFVGPSYLRGDGGRHGHLLEFGTANMAAQPFMRPAWDQDKDAMLQRLSTELAEQIRRAVSRADARAARAARAAQE